VAVKSIAPQSHAAQFAASLSVSQRNHLRVLLAHQHACRDLKAALGITKQDTVSHAAHATGLAKLGQTIRLFKERLDRSAVDLRADDRLATAGKAGCL
jgi:hypothetical protein